MAAAQLTDEELFSELKRFGFTPGPVTENTRPVYLKKLKKFREEQQLRGPRSVKSRSSTGINSTAGGGNTAGARPVSHDVTHLSLGRRPGRKSSVLGFSSDESDAEAPLKRTGLKPIGRAHRTVGLQLHPPIRPNATLSVDSQSPAGTGNTVNSNSSVPGLDERRGGSLSWGFRAASRTEANESDREESGDDDDEEGDAEKKSFSLNGNRTSCFSSSKLAADYSDSDEEEVEGLSTLDREESRGTYSKTSHRVGRGSLAGGAVRLIDPPGSLNMVGIRRPDDERDRGELGLSGSLLKRNFPIKSTTYTSIPVNHERKADGNNHVDDEEPSSTSSSTNTSGLSIGLRPRFSSSYNNMSLSYRTNHSNHTGPNHSYSQAALKKKMTVPEEELLQQFKREEVTSSGSFSAHYLSMFLLTAACLFFLVLGLMYLRMRGSGAAQGDGVVKSHPFGPEFDNAYTKEQKDTILKLLLSLHEHLALIAGRHDCGEEQLNRSLSMDEACAYLQAQNPDFKNYTVVSLEWIIRAGQDVGIKFIGLFGDEPVAEVSEISQLESTHPKMTFTCRFRRAFLTVISRVSLIVAVVGCVWALLCYMKYRWRREEEETRQMYDMVERIIDVLRSHSEACQENQDLQPYLPIPHVRDSLVQPQDRKKMKSVWDRAVRFLSANESRIRTESQQIGGSDFEVWRWIQPSLSCDKISSPSKVWQGKAFPLDRRNSPPNSLTPCLKIRNMFDPVMEVGENWDLAIHEAILEKCSDNDGIVHIAVDKNSREGCVYVKCLSAEYSGKAFKALHGSWFDGKLVTVKYLRLDRYHQRFPQAQGSCVPLKASSLNVSTTNTSSPRLQHYSSVNRTSLS